MPYKWFKRGFATQAAIWAACGMAFILFGYDQGVFSGILINEDFLDIVDRPNDSMTGIIVSIYNLGCFSGCFIAFGIGDRVGRRWSMWIAMIFVLVGATLQTTAYGVPHMMVARYVTGLGTGIETSTVPMYQSELSEPHRRGRLVCSEPLLVGVGIVIAYFFDYGMSFVGGPIAWRLPIACQMIFAIVVIVLVFGLPESPRWLYKKGRNEEALQVLCDVYDREPDHPKIVQEQREVLDAIATEMEEGEYKWRNLFKRDKVATGRRVWMAWMMQFFNQMGGINLVVYYTPTVLQDNVGLSHNLSLILGGCIQIMFVVGSFYPALFCDSQGRRRPMMWGSAGLGFCMMMISVLLSFRGKSNEGGTPEAAVGFFFLYMLIFGASVNCIPWCYVPEILPLHVRAKGTAVGISSNWIWNFFIVMVTPILINRLQWKAYLIFMVLNWSFVPMIYFFFPETANLSLEEIDFLFTNPEKDAVKLSKELRKERKGGQRNSSFVTGVAIPGDAEKGRSDNSTEHLEQSKI